MAIPCDANAPTLDEKRAKLKRLKKKAKLLGDSLWSLTRAMTAAEHKWLADACRSIRTLSKEIARQRTEPAAMTSAA